MAGYFSTHLSNELLDHTLSNSSYTSPTNVYLALFTTNPNADASGTEVTGGSYARQSMTYGTASAGSATTTADISFTDLPTATITHWAIFDASTSGNLLYYGDFGVSYEVNSGDDLTIATGEADITLKTS